MADTPYRAPLVELPYGTRQRIVVVPDDVPEAENDPGAAGDRDQPRRPWGVLRGDPRHPTLKALKEADDDGLRLLPVRQSHVGQLDMPIGHPLPNVVYIGSPAVAERYYPIADFHVRVFEERFGEAMRLLMALGAERLTVRSEHGWKRDISANIEAPIKRVLKITPSCASAAAATALSSSRPNSCLPPCPRFPTALCGSTTSRPGRPLRRVVQGTACGSSNYRSPHARTSGSMPMSRARSASGRSSVSAAGSRSRSTRRGYSKGHSVRRPSADGGAEGDRPGQGDHRPRPRRRAGDLHHRLSQWLRQQRDAGHPVLASFPARSAFRFTRAQTDQLAAEFAAADSDGHVSDSAVQRRAEEVIRALLSQRLGVRLAPRTIKLAAGAPVQVDAASDDGKVLAEIFARQGPLKGGQQKKVAIDTLKLITVHREQPAERLVICFADREASAYATGGGWVAQALRTWGVHVEIVDIPADLRAEILAAQAGQTMVNPA